MKDSPVVTMTDCCKKLGRSGDAAVQFGVEHLELNGGEHIALTGPSGCGKSTCLNLLSGLLLPDSGSVVIAGKKLETLSPRGLDRFRGEKIGFVYQTFHLLEAFSALENVLIGMRFGRRIPKSERHQRAEEMLDRVGLSHRLSSKPTTLSVGEKQRVAIARALVNQPSIILADEPTGSLDPNTADSVFKLLVELCRAENTTLVIVTHDLELAGKLDRQIDCRGFVKKISAKSEMGTES